MINQENKHDEERKLFFLTIKYYWLDVHSYLDSHHHISILKTYEEIPGHEYHLKFSNKTFLIDLGKSVEDLFSELGATRYDINKAVKHGVLVKRAETPSEKRRFYEFYQEFAGQPVRKDKMLLLRESEIDNMDIFQAISPENEYLGGMGLLASVDKRYLYYKYGASIHKYSESYLLLWHAIQYAKAMNYAYFDMSYVYPDAPEDSDQYRLYKFKKKFGGTLVPFYTYVKVRGPLVAFLVLFRIILKRLFHDDLNRFALFLKKMKVFR